jgi:DNA-binding GntR family transcriptional regulator
VPLPLKENQINRLPIREDVFRKLLNWIMDGTLRPGEKIVDKELAEHMGVSRTPVREALRRLEDKGLVESSANRWTRISEIPSKEPEMIYPIIWTLEKLALSIAISSMTEKDFAKMERVNNELKVALEKNDSVAASNADAKFHGIFLERSHNVHLIKIIEDLKIKYRRIEVNFFEGLLIAKSSIEEHKALIAALRAGDIVLAEKILHSNWEKGLERLRRNEENRDNVLEIAK